MSLLFGGSSYTDLIKDNNRDLWSTTPIIFPTVTQLKSTDEWISCVNKIMYLVFDAFYSCQSSVECKVPVKYKKDIIQYLKNSGYDCYEKDENILLISGW